MSAARDALPRPADGWRRYARVAALALLAVSVAWGGVRLVDPLPRTGGAEPVDVDAAPAQLAHRAMLQTERGRYVVEQFAGNDTARERFFRLRVDAPDGRIRGNVTVGGPEHGTATTEVYASDAGTWNREWRNGTTASPWDLRMPTSPYLFRHEDAVLDDGANVSVVAANASTVVVRVNDTDTAYRLATGQENATESDRAPLATLTLAVDREAGVLRWSRFRHSRLEGEEGNETREVYVVVNRFRDWGDVDVRRPTGLPYSFDTVLHDLRNTCPECEEGER